MDFQKENNTYIVNLNIENIKTFGAWLFSLSEQQVSIKINNEIWRFSNLQERCCFIFGINFAFSLMEKDKSTWEDRDKTTELNNLISEFANKLANYSNDYRLIHRYDLYSSEGFKNLTE